MAFELAPDPGDRGEPDARRGAGGGSALAEERRLLACGAQVLTRGALVCPSCTLPIPPPLPRVRPRAELRCGFCAHTGPAIAFLAEGVRDTPANDVVLVARVT